MALTNKELMLAEAVKNMLNAAALGDKTHEDRVDTERANTFTFLHEEIEQAFRLETMDLSHRDDICSSFSKIHSYRYLDDPSFEYSFKREMNARAVPLDEQEKALKLTSKIRKKYLDGNEKDAGCQPDLDKIIDASQPQQIGESIEPVDNYANDRRFYKDPKVRSWVNKQSTFWESIDKHIIPHLNALGYKCNDHNTFWEAYDDDSVELVIRDMLHELTENLRARFDAHISESSK